jgi:hypothetical protein
MYSTAQSLLQYRQKKEKHDESYTTILKMRPFHLTDRQTHTETHIRYTTLYGVRSPNIINLIALKCHKIGTVSRENEVQHTAAEGSPEMSVCWCLTEIGTGSGLPLGGS